MPAAAPILGNIAINLAIGIGASILSSIIRPAAQTSQTTTSNGVSFDVTVGEAVPVFSIWGQGATGGHLIFAQEYGENNDFLKIVVVQGKGWYDSLQTFFVDGKLQTLTGSNDDADGKVVEGFRADSSGTVGPSGDPYMWIKTYDGRPGQTADPGLIAAANPTDRWTSAHTLTGTPYAIITMKWNSNLYGGSLPTFLFGWKGLKLYDFRKDSTVMGGSGAHRFSDPTTWEWTENPSVIAYNWRRGYWINDVRIMGFGFSVYANDLEYFVAAANVSDESVYYPETGRSLARYAYGRSIDDSEDRLSVQQEFEAAWSGASFDRGGAYAPLPASTMVSVLELTDAHRYQDDQGRPAPVTADKYGKVSAKKSIYQGSYTSIADSWQSTPYGTRMNADLKTQMGGDRSAQFDQVYEHEPERAQMRAEISLRRNLFPASRTETFGPRALVLEPGDAFTRTCAWGSVLMIVQEIDRLPGNMGATIVMTQWDNDIVPTGSFVTVPSGPGTGPADPDRTIAVSAFGIDAYSISGGGSIHAGAKATWTQITDPNCDQVIIKVWPTSGSETDDAQYYPASALLTSSRIVGPLAPSTPYTARALLTRKDGRSTIATNTVGFTTGVEATPVADGSVDNDQLALRMQALINFFKNLAADLQENVDRIASTQQDQDAANYVDKQQVVQQIGIAVASFSQELSLLADDNEATALLVQSLNAALGGNSAQVNVIWEAQAAPDGFAARYAIRCQADDGQLRQATLFIDVPADPNGKTRIGLSADETVFFAGDGTPIALINGDGEIISANGAVYVNLFTGALRLTKV